MRTAQRAVAWSVGVLVALPLLYLLAALILGLIPVNTDFMPAEDGVSIFVRTNGVHAEFVLPTRGYDVDWSAEHPASDMRDLRQPQSWIAFGWGDRGFFVNTATWGDLTLGTALVALSGVGQGAMHVEYVASPLAYRAREVRLSVMQYRRVASYVRASFARDAAGRPQRFDDPGYSNADAFYAAVPPYAIWNTSNEWVRRGLAEAGVRTARWSPFDIAIFYHLP